MKRIAIIFIVGMISVSALGQSWLKVTDAERKEKKYVFNIEQLKFVGFFSTRNHDNGCFFQIEVKNSAFTHRIYRIDKYIPKGGRGKYVEYQSNLYVLTDTPITDIVANGYASDSHNNLGYIGSDEITGFPFGHKINSNLCGVGHIESGQSEDDYAWLHNVFFDEWNISKYIDAYQGYKFDYCLLPLHYIVTDSVGVAMGQTLYNTYLPSDDKINIYDKEDFPEDIYRFQYSIDEGFSWIDINNSLYQGNKLSVSAQDLFPNNYKDMVGKKIFFRSASCPDTNGDYKVWSNIIPLTITPSAPHITTLSVTPAKCFDSNDGSVTFSFDRKKYPNERIEFMIDGVSHTKGILVDTLTNNTYNVTLLNLTPGTHTLSFMGIYTYNNGNDSINTYTGNELHSKTINILKPEPITFTVAKTDINCHNGSDGTITLTANGGQGVYQYSPDKGNTWVDFSNTTFTKLQKLALGSYSFQVRDTNLCMAKNADGSVKEITVTLTQPNEPLVITESEIFHPTGFGLSNGYISVTIKGGTPLTDGSYHYEWRKGSTTGAILSNNIITQFNADKSFTIKIADITAGKYFFTVKDRNYANAKDSIQNCGFLWEEYIVSQPDPLKVNISLEKCISCNIENEYEYKVDKNANDIPDEAEDAIIKAMVKGGVEPYTYQWQIKSGMVYKNIPNAATNKMEGIGTGVYRILITDKNNNKTQAELLVPYPDKLSLVMTGSELNCNNLENGQVSVTATGGRGNYTYEWSTLDDTPTVKGLFAGNYFVLVRDSAQCAVKGVASVKQPNGLEITDISVQNPICYGTNTGSIRIKVSGGVTPYSVKWSNGMTGETIKDLTAGEYIVTFTDAKGCKAIKSYILTEPEEFKIDLGADITLCQGDSKIYDVKIDDDGATYQWKDNAGKTLTDKSKITLSKAGVYTATVTTSKGCVASDKIVVKSSVSVLKPEFMLTTHAFTYKNVVLINTSPVKPEKTEWVIPESNDIRVLSNTPDSLEVMFIKSGGYELGLRGIQGACDKTLFKKIIIEENNFGTVEKIDTRSNIKNFLIKPNPNNGKYEVVVELYEKAEITLRIFNMVSQSPYAPTVLLASTSFSVPFNYTLTKGMYLVTLHTGKEMIVKRMLVK